jgi:hypothetical protein
MANDMGISRGETCPRPTPVRTFAADAAQLLPESIIRISWDIRRGLPLSAKCYNVTLTYC